MTKTNQIYQCGVCGNIVAIVHPGDGTLVCCDEDMKLLEEKSPEQEGKEKHVPVIEIEENVVKVKVGSNPHPMEDKHFIEFIELLKDGKAIYSKRLYPGQNPEAEFIVEDAVNIKAREYCNIHGLWISS